MNRKILMIFTALMLAGCSTGSWMAAEPGQTGPANRVRPADIAALTTSLPPAMKGYELYSWYVEPEGAWYYTLVTGSNRLKTYEELVTPENTTGEEGWVKITVKGLVSLKAMLKYLPPGQELVWIDGLGRTQMPGEGKVFGFPEQDVVDEVEQYCRQLRIKLQLAGRED